MREPYRATKSTFSKSSSDIIDTSSMINVLHATHRFRACLLISCASSSFGFLPCARSYNVHAVTQARTAAVLAEPPRGSGETPVAHAHQADAGKAVQRLATNVERGHARQRRYKC